MRQKPGGTTNYNKGAKANSTSTKHPNWESFIFSTPFQLSKVTRERHQKSDFTTFITNRPPVAEIWLGSSKNIMWSVTEVQKTTKNSILLFANHYFASVGCFQYYFCSWQNPRKGYLADRWSILNSRAVDRPAANSISHFLPISSQWFFGARLDTSLNCNLFLLNPSALSSFRCLMSLFSNFLLLPTHPQKCKAVKQPSTSVAHSIKASVFKWDE